MCPIIWGRGFYFTLQDLKFPLLLLLPSPPNLQRVPSILFNFLLPQKKKKIPFKDCYLKSHAFLSPRPVVSALIYQNSFVLMVWFLFLMVILEQTQFSRTSLVLYKCLYQERNILLGFGDHFSTYRKLHLQYCPLVMLRVQILQFHLFFSLLFTDFGGYMERDLDLSLPIIIFTCPEIDLFIKNIKIQQCPKTYKKN